VEGAEDTALHAVIKLQTQADHPLHFIHVGTNNHNISYRNAIQLKAFPPQVLTAY
jgi:hypothetical protein